MKVTQRSSSFQSFVHLNISPSYIYLDNLPLSSLLDFRKENIQPTTTQQTNNKLNSIKTTKFTPPSSAKTKFNSKKNEDDDDDDDKPITSLLPTKSAHINKNNLKKDINNNNNNNNNNNKEHTFRSSDQRVSSAQSIGVWYVLFESYISSRYLIVSFTL